MNTPRLLQLLTYQKNKKQRLQNGGNNKSQKSKHQHIVRANIHKTAQLNQIVVGNQEDLFPIAPSRASQFCAPLILVQSFVCKTMNCFESIHFQENNVTCCAFGASFENRYKCRGGGFFLSELNQLLKMRTAIKMMTALLTHAEESST